ncbi:5488_t:CDS:1, partial [Ambispora leptoticha]
IDAKHNSTRDTMFNEILANRDARLITELADRDARFVTELTDYRAKFNAEFTLRDEKFTAEIQRILTMINTSTAKFDEIEQVLQTYHNNFGRVAAEFELINGSISMLQNEINRYYAVVQARSDISPEIRIEPIEEAEPGDNANQSEASDSSQRSFSDTTSEIWNQFKIIFDRIMAERGCSFDDMCNIVMIDLLNLRVGKLSKDIIKNYYRKINDLRGSNLDKIGAWIDSKTVNSE